MSNSKTNNKRTNRNSVSNVIPLAQQIQDNLPYIKEIRASWIANISHCKDDSPCGRDSLKRNGVKMCKDWSGETGFLRYYIWHIDNNYIPGKSKLLRIDSTKGFCPTNCKVIDKSASSKKKTKDSSNKGVCKTELLNSESTVPINNIFIFVAKENQNSEVLSNCLMSLGISPEQKEKN